MQHPVDLTNLREMTDGDRELEKALFEEFFVSGGEAVATMQKGCVAGADEAWRASAHALKGAAYNLGAQALGDACKKAQEAYAAGLAEKRALLREIVAAYAAAKEFLEKTHS